MKTSRQRILDYLRDKPAVTANEIGHILKVSPADARHHLSILVEQGSLEILGQRFSYRRGRPATIYGLTHNAPQHNLHGLSSALLSELIDTIPHNNTRQTVLRNLAHRLCASVCENQSISNPTSRLYATIQCLNQMHYQSRWEAHIEGPRLMFGHCPYEAILDQHPELCEMDIFVLSEMLAAPVTQVTKRNLTPLGTRQCMFLIGHGK
jgi:predicted ArsR family transcriptional regulator